MSCTQFCLPPSSMSLTCPGPVARQHNCEKSSAPLRQNKYNSKPHTPPYKLGSSANGNHPQDNQQAPQIIEDNNNCKKTPSSDFSDSSIAAAVLWQLLIKNPVAFLTKKYPRSQGTLGKTSNKLYGTRTLQRVILVPSKCCHLFLLK